MKYIKKKYKPKIFIVDDDLDTIYFFRAVLEEDGFSVNTYSDPMIALQNFKPYYYDLLLIDIRMPKISGFQLIEEIRKMDNLTKVCFMSSFIAYYNAIHEQYPEIDIDSILKKPVTREELITHVRRGISSAE